jgi:2-methylcitrate dehydratase PrpD
MARSITERLAMFAASLTYDDLTAEVITMTKLLILDTLGTALAATTLGEGCQAVIDVMRARGGVPESSVLGHSGKISMLDAAFANGALAHALNYDAYGVESGHVGVTCFTAPLAAAEARRPIDGRQFITAVAAAAEVNARLTAGAMRGKRRTSEQIQAGQFFGYFAAAAGAGQIIGLSGDAMHNAFGLAVMQVAGSRQLIIEGDAPAKAIYGAFPNHGGVLSALLAEAGLQANVDAIGGRAGLYGLATGGNFDEQAVIGELGTSYRFLETQFKPWPVSAVVAPFIEAAINLTVEHDIRPDDIISVELGGPESIRQWCEPLDERRRPSNAASAANSTLFAAAKALVNRAVTLKDFTVAGLRDEVALALTARTTVRLDNGLANCEVNVLTNNGRTFGASIGNALGHPSRPITQQRLEEKFRDCCAESTLGASLNTDAVIDFIATLEHTDDASVLGSPLARPRFRL